MSPHLKPEHTRWGKEQYMSDSNSTKEQNTRVNCGWGKCVADCGIWRWPWAATASLCGAGVVEGQWGARLGGIGGSASRWGGGGKLGVLEAECGESGWTWAGAASAGAQSVARKGAFVGKRTGGGDPANAVGCACVVPETRSLPYPAIRKRPLPPIRPKRPKRPKRRRHPVLAPGFIKQPI